MYPTLKGSRAVKQVTNTFYGYNHSLKIGDGEFYDCENMSTDYFPLAGSSSKHSLVTTFNGTVDGVIFTDDIYFVGRRNNQEFDTLYSYTQNDTNLTGLSAGKKNLVAFGTYICIFPDGAYYNTKDHSDYGFMGCRWEYSTAAALKKIKVETCSEDGAVYDISEEGSEEPVSPTDGMLWVETYPDRILKKWSAAENKWVQVSDVYLKVTFLDDTNGDFTDKFREGDYIYFYSHTVAPLWDNILIAKAGDTLSTDGTVENTYMMIKADPYKSVTFTDRAVILFRNLPLMDYVVECQNRLWGCRYGTQRENFVERANTVVNEIYCCALGDFRNWYKYEGVSMDSWAASVGTEGAWTGAITFEGHPLFFKKDCVHQVTVSALGAHRVTDMQLCGVQERCADSLCIINNKLYYKSTGGVMEYQGGLTSKISGQLGEEYMFNACAAKKNNKLYIAMNDDGGQKLYVYDTLKRLWSKQKTTPNYPISFLTEFMASDEERIIAVTDNSNFYYLDNQNAGAVDSWSCESGIFTYNSGSRYSGSFTGGHRYISRFDIRLKMSADATAEMYVEYDSSGTWEFAGRINVVGTNSFVIPLRPRRCDHIRIKLKGSGEIRIFSVTRNLVMGSDNL